ncbi:auxin efflux carrier family protein, partial [Tremellales sp. Uapishka_1]
MSQTDNAVPGRFFLFHAWPCASSSFAVKVLLVTVFESITEVFLLCMAGYILSRAGVTDKATQRKLNVINVSLFTPALLFSKVAFSLTPAKLKEMWIIPLGFVVVTGVSAAVAWALSKVFKLKRSQQSFAICAAMFQNSNSLPIALIQSLVIEVPGLKWGSDDSKDQMLGRALTYLVLYSTLGMMVSSSYLITTVSLLSNQLRWSWGVKLLSQADEEAPTVTSAFPPLVSSPEQERPALLSPEAIPRPGARETDPFFSSNRAMSQDEREETRRSTLRDTSPAPSIQWTNGPGSAHSLHPPGTNRAPPLRRDSSQSGRQRPPTRTESGREFWGLPEFAKKREPELSDQEEEEEDSSDDSDSEPEDQEWVSIVGSTRGSLADPSIPQGDLPPQSLRRRTAPAPAHTRFRATMRQIRHKTKSVLKSVNAFMTVPMYAALLSIFIAMIPPLQAALVQVKPLGQAIRSAGQCSIPLTLVVLGAFFYAPPPSQSSSSISKTVDPEPASPEHFSPSLGYFERKIRSLASRPRNNDFPGENKAVFVAVVSRMIIVPLLMLPIIALIATYDLFEAAEDPVFILAAVLLVSSPPALTLAQITQAASGDAFERLISKTITWSYAILTPPLTLVYVVIGLVFGRL